MTKDVSRSRAYNGRSVLSLSLLFSIILELFSLVPLLAWQSPDQLTPKVRATVTRASDPDTPFRERLAAFQDLLKEPPATSHLALRELLGRADETFAVMSAIRLITEREKQVIELASPRFATWSYTGQWSFLGTILDYGPDPGIWGLSRLVLRKVADEKPSIEESSHAGRAAGAAALTLMQSPDSSDREIIRRALGAQPRVSVLWLVRTKGELLENNEREVAEAILKDELTPMSVRLSAAVALAPTKQDAAAFVTRAIRSFLLRYSDQDAELMLTHALQQRAQSLDQSQTDFANLLGELKLLGALQFLNTDAAEMFTFEYLDCKNQLVRKTLGLIAAIRWPGHLLRDRQDHIARAEYVNLLAVVSLYHPELGASLPSPAPVDSLNAARVKLHGSGLGSMFFKAYPAAFGF